MLVRFSSTETESITMFGDIAVRLIKMLGASGDIPGAISAKDIPNAIRQLKTNLQMQEPVVNGGAATNEGDREPPIGLDTRAHPLIDILQRSAAADAPVMWEKA
jgi:hypothetical protein